MPRNQFENHDEEEIKEDDFFIDYSNPAIPVEDLRGLWEREDRVIDAIQRRHQNAMRMLEEDRKKALEKGPE